MNEEFNNQKELLLSIRQEINLLRQQVDYLLRNEKELGLLDLDVLMNRTHTIYDKLCSINLGQKPDEEEMDLDPELLAGLFGQVENDENEEAANNENPEAEMSEEEPETEPEPDAEPVPLELEEETTVAEESITPEEEASDEPGEEVNAEAELIEETQPAEDVQSVEEPFVFRIEDVGSPVEPEEKIVHFMDPVEEDEILERDRIGGEDLIPENPFEMPAMEDETEQKPVEDKKPAEEVPEAPSFYPPTLNGETPSDPIFDFIDESKEVDEEKMDQQPEIATTPSGTDFGSVETLGERIEHEGTLGERLQQAPVLDLKDAIGINDKFLFVNELFGGSMEKYNKSIDNLNDLKTLNGALIYLNELKIELQWNSNNEAYKKLSDLVARKFE